MNDQTSEGFPALPWAQSAAGWTAVLPDGRTAVIERLDDGESFLPRVGDATGPVCDGALAAAQWASERVARPGAGTTGLAALRDRLGIGTFGSDRPGDECEDDDPHYERSRRAIELGEADPDGVELAAAGANLPAAQEALEAAATACLVAESSGDPEVLATVLAIAATAGDAAFPEGSAALAGFRAVLAAVIEETSCR